MTIDELIKNGIFEPINDINEIKKICEELKIPDIDTSFGPDFKVDSMYIDRIKYSSVINNSKLKKDMVDMHTEIINRYEDLKNKYKSLYDSIKGKPGFEKEESALKSIIKEIETQHDEYKNHIEKDIKASDLSEFLEQKFTKQDIGKASKKFHSIGDTTFNLMNEDIKDIDKDLSNLYKDQNRLNNYKSKNIFIRAKMNRVARKIQRLQSKKGKIEDNQRKIVTNNTTRYINKMNNRFDNFYEELAKFENAINIKQENINKRNELEQEKNELEQEIRNSGRIGKAIFGISRKNKEKEIARLNKKYCKVDLSQQYTYIFEHSYER